MKIVALERKNLGNDIDFTRFGKFGEFTEYEKTGIEQIYERSKDAQVLIINKLPMNESTLGALNRLRLICVTATGTDNVDLNYCKAHQIAVCNAKGYSTDSVVQHTFAMFFYLMEHLPYYDQYTKSGNYVKSETFTHFDRYFMELAHKTWGIVGMGDIGKKVAAAAKAFGCEVIYYSTSGNNQFDGAERVEWDALLERSDVISIHAPLNERTRNLFDLQAFKKMKSSAYLVNVGRGPIVNESDLCKALKDQLIAGAALDVLSQEPMREDNPLFEVIDQENLLITPHIAWATTEARNRLTDEVYKNIESYLNGGTYGRLC
ncbi:MAG: D-2-hydroxyacid dehydrogenase [Clostridia bacterium]|nr:D-2-hydroxyacid dehydrogenase [Clostridia bacterium]